METILLVLLAIVSSTALTTVISHVLTQRRYKAEVLKVHSDSALSDATSKDLITQASERALNMVVNQLEMAQKRILHLEEELNKALERITTLETKLSAKDQELAKMNGQLKRRATDVREDSE